MPVTQQLGPWGRQAGLWEGGFGSSVLAGRKGWPVAQTIWVIWGQSCLWHRVSQVMDDGLYKTLVELERLRKCLVIADTDSCR